MRLCLKCVHLLRNANVLVHAAAAAAAANARFPF